MGNSAGVALLVIGLVLGPVYYVYSHFLSGEAVAIYPLPATDNQPRPLQMELAPDMGNIGLVLRFQAEHGPVMTPAQMPQNRYRAILKTAGQTIFDKPFTLSSKSVESEVLLSYSEAMPAFRAETKGVYELEISQIGEAGMKLVGADVLVRKNVVEPNSALITVGIGLLIAGLVMLLA